MHKGQNPPESSSARRILHFGQTRIVRGHGVTSLGTESCAEFWTSGLMEQSDLRLRLRNRRDHESHHRLRKDPKPSDQLPHAKSSCTAFANGGSRSLQLES